MSANNSRDDALGSGHRPRRPRIATWSATTWRIGGDGQRPPSAAAEDRNLYYRVLVGAEFRQRPPSAAAEDRNVTGSPVTAERGGAAAAVRGGRGSQPLRRPGPRAHFTAAAAVRGGRGSQRSYSSDPHLSSWQRPPSAAAEDRNIYMREKKVFEPTSSGRRPRRPRIATRWTASPAAPLVSAAAAVRGGRGSQHPLEGPQPAAHRRQRPPSAAAEDRNEVGYVGDQRYVRAAAAVRGGRGSQRGQLGVRYRYVRRSGRRPRRPRIATVRRSSTRCT